MANTKISGLTPSVADLAATDVLPVVQTTGVGPVKMTGTQIKTGIVGAGAVSIAALKTLTASNTLTLAGTDSTTMTFPSTNATLARTDAGQTFTGSQTFNGDAFNITSATAFSPLFTIWNQTASANSAYCILQKTRAASGAGSAVQVNDVMGAFLFRGADTGGVLRNSSYLEAVVTAVSGTAIDSGFRFNALGTTSYVSYLVNGSERVRFDASGNILLGTTVSPTTGAQCLTIETGTAATASPADTITIYSTDLSAGNTMLSLYTEGTPVSANTTTTNLASRIAIRVNGTVYYLLAASAA
jgi:hypothetical protein